VINANGCLVLPGLIDFHTHLFYQGSQHGVPADAALLPLGIKTAIDGGTAGISNYELFYKSVVVNSVVRIKSYLNVSPTGMATATYDENINPKYFEEERIEQLFSTYPGELLGLKARANKEAVGELGIEPVKAMLRIAEKISCPIAVHTTNPPISTEELVDIFWPNDVFVHVYHVAGNTILDGNNKVLTAVKEARKRGVIFDAANGRGHFAFKTAQAALNENFVP